MREQTKIFLGDSTKAKEPLNKFFLGFEFFFNGLDALRLLLIIIKLTRYYGRQRHYLGLLALNANRVSRSKQFRDCVSTRDTSENN